MNKASLDNLKSLAKRAPEEQREISRTGGINSGSKRRRQKAIRESLQIVMNTESSEFPGNMILDDMVIACVKRILKTGDPNQFEKLLSLAGLTPEEKRREKKMKLLEDEIKLRTQGQILSDIEDLTTLADLINDDK